MTKSKLLTTAASLTLISAALISLDGFARGGEGERQGHSEDARMTLLERLDSNADGVLGLDEFTERNAEHAQRRFDKKDTDSDALLSLEEYSSRGHHRRHPMLEGLDTDALELCLADALGYQSPERPDSETAFAAADVNSDGSVDLDEFLAAGSLRAEERFEEIDSDGDGQLTSDEIDADRSLRRARKDAHRSCVAEQMDEDSMYNQVL